MSKGIKSNFTDAEGDVKLNEKALRAARLAKGRIYNTPRDTI